MTPVLNIFGSFQSYVIAIGIELSILGSNKSA
eukprot:CAMPEP_0204117680 /NCGR_PEP_ID=MMETSP0361-20130328/6115_1 /ASSEMBLY_ACC=CAM_ASM_000343 /TAXON_ID=268821 /ORGANISM="Scrippsiella Hangoei, Strain SHTV-5" /LENGTH=31 /DNA_ID= /DNA_START= /DNA_END= /DNA_ORIENTATION=